MRDILTIFEREEEKKSERKNLEKKKKKINNRSVKDRVLGHILIRVIRTLFQQQEEKDYYQPRRVNNFWNNNYIEDDGNGHKNRTVS